MEHSTLSVETLNPRTTKPGKEYTNRGQEPYNDDADQNTEEQYGVKLETARTNPRTTMTKRRESGRNKLIATRRRREEWRAVR